MEKSITLFGRFNRELSIKAIQLILATRYAIDILKFFIWSKNQFTAFDIKISKFYFRIEIFKYIKVTSFFF